MTSDGTNRIWHCQQEEVHFYYTRLWPTALKISRLSWRTVPLKTKSFTLYGSTELEEVHVHYQMGIDALHIIMFSSVSFVKREGDSAVAVTVSLLFS
jgi:hypothetical protein